MMMRLLALALILPLARLHTQSSVSPQAKNTQLPAILLGSGVTTQAGSTNAQLNTDAGGLVMIGIEVPISRTTRNSRYAIRAESRWSHQSLATGASSGVSGDVRTVSAGLLLRVSPFASPTPSSFGITPYLLAGVGVSRPSTRVSVSIDNPDMPSARFGQTTSEVAPAALGGLGALFRAGPAHLFAEVRTEFANLNAGTRRATFGTLGVVFHPSR